MKIVISGEPDSGENLLTVATGIECRPAGDDASQVY